MKSLSTLIQSGDWKGEKHVPVIHLSNLRFVLMYLNFSY